MPKFVVYIIMLAAALITFFSLKPDTAKDLPQKGDYLQAIMKQRSEKDTYFKTSADSPIHNKKHFKGLKYYAADPVYKLTLKPSLLPLPSTVEFNTSDGDKRSYITFATATFTLNGQTDTLYLYKNAENTDKKDFELFVPFTDPTNGDETYGGGRYIDAFYAGQGDIVIDFNNAYNPYCAYNHDYSCPIPPRTNHLRMAIKAGEKAYQ